MPCRKCNTDLQDTWLFCPMCGLRVNKQKKKAASHGNGMGGVVKAANGTYMARVTVGWTAEHKPIRKTKSGFKTKTEAMAYINTLKSTPHDVGDALSLRQLYDRWEPFYEPRVGTDTFKSYKSAFKHFHAIEHMKLQAINVEHLQDCIDRVVASGKGRSTINNMKTVCGLLYKYARQLKIDVVDPTEHLYVGAVQKGERLPITEAQLELVKQAIGTEPYAEYVYCLCYLGYRPGEMLERKKTDYNAEEKCFYGGKKTAAGRNRIVTIPPAIQPIIDRLMEQPGEYVFPRLDTGLQMSDQYFRESIFKPMMDRLGIEDHLVPYSARHTYANKLKRVQGSDVDKAELIGHSDATMTKKYQSPDYEALKNITDKMK